MGVVVPVGEAQASFLFACAGVSKDITWTIGVKSDTPGATASEIAADVYESITVTTDPRGPFYDSSSILTGWTFLGVSVSLMTATGPLVGEFRDSITHVGTAVQPIPANCCFLATKTTALGGRTNKGRAYLPPTHIPESDVDAAGNAPSIAVGVMSDSLGAFLSELGAHDLVPLIHHSDGSPGTPITAITVGSLIATQRRRLR